MIYYDITDLIEFFRKSSRISGVQRVSIATIAYFQKAEVRSEVQLLAYHPVLRRLAACDVDDFPVGLCSGALLSACLGVRYKGPHPLDEYLQRRYRSRLARQLHKWRLSLANRISGGHTFRRKCATAVDQSSTPAPLSWRPADLSSGDVVLVSTGLRSKSPVFSLLAKARRDSGVRLVQFILDVLPISHPQFFLQGHPLTFADGLMAMNANADHVITTAKWNALEYDKEIRNRKQALPPISIAPLAHEFLDNPELRGKPLYEQVSQAVLGAARLPYALCVGTREIRKNNLGLAQAWARLERKYGPVLPRLIFAGRNGWLNDETDRFLQKTQNANGSIIVIDGPSDAELAFLYKNCLFSVFPSFCEGWGLPIGESLWFGRPVIASNLTAMPEVAGDYADYINPYDFNSLEKAIERMLDPAYREERAQSLRGMKMRLWDDYAADLLAVLRQVHGGPAPD